MGNRVSKSVVISYSATVKEQRVNGYKYIYNIYFICIIYLRCILISLEISYD